MHRVDPAQPSEVRGKAAGLAPIEALEMAVEEAVGIEIDDQRPGDRVLGGLAERAGRLDRLTHRSGFRKMPQVELPDRVGCVHGGCPFVVVVDTGRGPDCPPPALVSSRKVRAHPPGLDKGLSTPLPKCDDVRSERRAARGEASRRTWPSDLGGAITKQMAARRPNPGGARRLRAISALRLLGGEPAPACVGAP